MWDVLEELRGCLQPPQADSRGQQQQVTVVHITICQQPNCEEKVPEVYIGNFVEWAKLHQNFKNKELSQASQRFSTSSKSLPPTGSNSDAMEETAIGMAAPLSAIL